MTGAGLPRQFAQLDQLRRGHPLAFAQYHFAGFDLVHDRFDAGDRPLLALLGFIAVQRDVGLNQALAQFGHQIDQSVVKLLDQGFGHNPHHGLGLVRPVILAQRENRFFGLAANIAQLDALFGLFEQLFLIGDHAIGHDVGYHPNDDVRDR